MQNGNGQHRFFQPFGNSDAPLGLRARMGDSAAPTDSRTPIAVSLRRHEAPSVQVAADLFETNDAVVVVMDMPGHDPSVMAVHLDKGILTVRSKVEASATKGREYHLAERRSHAIQRAFKMPASVDPNRIAASFDAGVLTVTLHKREESKPRKIEVQFS